MKVYAIAAALLLAAGQSVAVTQGATTTFAGVTWATSTQVSGLSACTQLYVDISGDVANSKSFIAYGALNCPALNGGYAATGVGYIGTNGSFNMTLTIGAGNQIACTNLAGFSGTCSVYGPSGNYLGPVQVTFTL